MKSLKLIRTESFGANISKLFRCRNMLEAYPLLEDKLLNKVVADIDVFCHAVLNMILGNIDSTRIGAVQCHDILRIIILSKHLFH